MAFPFNKPGFIMRNMEKQKECHYVSKQRTVVLSINHSARGDILNALSYVSFVGCVSRSALR